MKLKKLWIVCRQLKVRALLLIVLFTNKTIKLYINLGQRIISISERINLFFSHRNHRETLLAFNLELLYPAVLGAMIVKILEINIYEIEKIYILLIVQYLTYFSISFLRGRKEIQKTGFRYNAFMFGWDIVEILTVFYVVTLIVEQGDRHQLYQVSIWFMIFRNCWRIFSNTGTTKKFVLNFITIIWFVFLYYTIEYPIIEFTLVSTLTVILVYYAFHTFSYLDKSEYKSK